jgi:putative two-component system response regulator
LDDATLKTARILIIDDEEANVLLLERLLERDGYTRVMSTTDSTTAVALCAGQPPDIVLLDLHMPSPDGFEVMELLAPWIKERWFPILVLTADITPEATERALSSGARDFVTKPFNGKEVLLRIKNLLEVRFLQLELRKQNLTLDQRVRERTEDLHIARLNALERLALAAEYRDDDTREHTRRVGRTAGLIAGRLGLGDDEVELITIAAPLHDVGKIGVPDRILLKPGKLTDREFELMQSHVEIGRSILSGSDAPVLEMSAQIASSHHEWWDGRGYSAGLEGTEIPIAGRIVAVADVFDALTHDRPYKKAWTVKAALEEIRSLSGRQFDPDVVEAFETLNHGELLTLPDAPSPLARASSSNGSGGTALAGSGATTRPLPERD